VRRAADEQIVGVEALLEFPPARAAAYVGAGGPPPIRVEEIRRVGHGFERERLTPTAEAPGDGCREFGEPTRPVA
jgi:hypothetical protein